MMPIRPVISTMISEYLFEDMMDGGEMRKEERL
jgi:hypothetical protein